MLGAGRLTERIDVVRPVRVQRPDGGFETELETVLNTYANVRELRVSNDLIASQEEFKESLEVIIRYRQDIHIKIGDKVLWRGRQLEIIGLPSGFINRKEIRIIARMINETTDNG